MEAHVRAINQPNFRYAIVRNTYADLLKSHLTNIEYEMEALGGRYLKTDKQAQYKNGSIGFYTHCGESSELGNLLSAEFYWLGVDELPEIEFENFRKMAASCRAPKHLGIKPLIRGVGNPAGPSIDLCWSYFIDKDVDLLVDKYYDPSEWHAIQTKLADNTHIDEEEYRKTLSGVPTHIQKAWLDGERVDESAYFNLNTSHFITETPTLHATATEPPPYVYRAMDWGTHDATVCLWIAVYASGRAIVFKERTWTHTTAATVAKEIKQESEGMRVIETFCDPTMFRNSEATDGNDIGDQIENQGIPLVKSVNDRVGAGYAISGFLNTTLPDGKPRLQIYAPWCPMLTKTLPLMRSDPKNPGRIADGKDHWTITLAYFCLSSVAAPRPTVEPRRKFLYSQTDSRRVLGSESVRRK